MIYFFNFCVALSLLFCMTSVHAQNFPVYNNFFINPYLYNPAEAVTDYTYVYALHRQQWTGIEGAPTVSTLTFNTMLNESRAGFGGKISQYKRGLLTTNDITLSYAYAMPVGQKNWLMFGLSGGAISNTIDMAKVSDPNDPVLLEYTANNMQPVSSFGMLYRSGSGFNLGFSLPQLFPPKFNNPGSFTNTTVSPADNVFVTVYYKRKVESKIVSKRSGNVKRKVKTKETIAPLEFYFNYKYSKFGTSQFELLGKLNLSEHFWLGGSYRLPYGLTGNTGFKINRLILAYSYEPVNQPEEGFSQGTHEFMLGLRLGQKKKFKRVAPVLRSTLTKNPAEKHTARFQEGTTDPNEINQTESANKRYFVVVKVFVDFNQADAYKRRLQNEQFNGDIFYNPQDRKYYVHVLETTKASEAHEEIKNLKTYTKIKNARLLVVTGEK
ncbi:PorP/SprF family type IX secretion system membrane protein [Parachryseolinea silvisoli]|jgi:type IX secretion system PorP/SprF family membrane protein|uniref:PorP/SprF family type IX secretion system membrane protein n=1 Tax=Parachryseolinea silvisoli TaxID=2873601 RepID=UPI0022659E81|nr:type IX secretion system membrane protein PorP/SprF [Parachryseolinea silvisoli]